MENLAHDVNQPSGLTDGSSETPQQTVAPVPRVSVQAFCETTDVQAVIQDAFEDRRMAKTMRTVQMGGLSAAVEFYQSSPTPNLIIVESQGSSDTIAAGLEELAEVCDSGTRVIVIGHLNDVLLYRDLVRKGISEYVVAPVAPIQLVEVISEIYTAPESDPVGRVIAFAGARGGVGSSTVAHNVGWAISTEFETNVVIADMDLPFGTAGLDFNQDPVQGLANAVFENERADEQMIERLLFKCTDRLSLLAAPATLEREYDLSPGAYETILEIMRKTVPCTVLDVPHVWSGWARNALWTADEVVITATPDLASLRNTKNLIELLKSQRKHDNPPRLVLNQAGVPKRPEIAPSDFSAALELEPIAVIPFDPQLFGMAANNGQMIAEMGQSTKVTDMFVEIAKITTGRTIEKRGRGSAISGLLKRFKKRKGAGE